MKINFRTRGLTHQQFNHLSAVFLQRLFRLTVAFAFNLNFQSIKVSPKLDVHQICEARVGVIVFGLDDDFLIIHGAALAAMAEHQGHQVNVFIVHCRRHRHMLLTRPGSVRVTPYVLYRRRFFRTGSVAEKGEQKSFILSD